MPSITAHAVAGATIASVFPPAALPRRAWIAGSLLAMAPDLDSISFSLGVSYDNPFGHRGMTHSLLVGVIAGLACAAIAAATGRDRGKFRLLAVYLVVATVSHGLLDTLTDGGRGVALLWPFSDERFFAPFRPIAVSPISPIRFFSMRGVHVVMSEALWVGLPCLVVFACVRLARSRPSRARASR